jgi:hypothetical protein
MVLISCWCPCADLRVAVLESPLITYCEILLPITATAFAYQSNIHRKDGLRSYTNKMGDYRIGIPCSQLITFRRAASI